MQYTSLAPAGKRLMLTGLISLALHLLIIFGIQVGAVEQGGKSRLRIEARLVPSAEGAAEVLVKAIEGPVKSQAQDFQPLPQVVPSATSVPSEETPQPGMSAAAASPRMVDAPLPVDATYYDAKEVDVPPRKLGDPLYPERASKLNIGGKVRLRLLLNEHGAVDEVTILAVDPPGWGFEEAVLAYLKSGRFKPAIRKGRAVRSTVNYELEFSVEEQRVNN